ncbi:transporter [Aerococcaceae bacterium zg-ZUI334]|uniref:lipopolysaccharide biosynthesis protein n=1 Tax=Aerococcaceae bacterium zg-252 TaxID=2796928 RepID=UPI001B90DDD4|nr:transporter [Aerococcaceae bacterium zg-ZUI334]
MTKKTRTQKAFYNSVSPLILFTMKLIMQFVNRTLFIKYLGIYYLGLNGVFSNVLGMLSLAELGFGISIIYALYKPIAENKKEKVLAYMNLYSKAYKFIAIIIFLIGIVVYPFLPTILQTTSLNFEETCIYFLFLINSIVGYLLFSYKRGLLIANQENYIVSWLEFVLYFLITICQWLVMIFTQNYIFVLILTICYSISSNLLIAFVANKRYSLVNIVPDALTQEEKNSLKKNVLGNILGKISGFVVFSTDNILISTFISVTTVGLYSNYTIITTSFATLINQIMVSQTASVGNLIHTSSSDKVYEVFKRYHFINFAISYIVSILIFVLINPFITIWLGDEYLFKQEVVAILSIYFFMHNYRNAGFIVRDAYGLYWESRYKPIAEAVSNLVFSLLFLVVFKWGISGILLGTICSNLLTNTWYEPYIIFKYGLKMTIKEYIWINIQQWAVYFSTLLGLYFLAPQKWFDPSLLGWLQLAVVLGSSLIVVLLIVFHKDATFRWWLNFVKQAFIKIRRK